MKEGHSPIPIVACDTNLKEEVKIKKGFNFHLSFAMPKLHSDPANWFFYLIGFKKLVAQSYLV